MVKALTLFDAPEPVPFERTQTSIEAARRISKGGKSAFDRERIYQYLRRAGEASRPRIAHELGMSPDTVRPRVWELMGNTPKGALERGAEAFHARIIEIPGKREDFMSHKNCSLLKVKE